MRPRGCPTPPRRIWRRSGGGGFYTLYQREEPHTPGLPLATHVNPAKVNNDIPSEAEVEAAVCRLFQHSAGVHTCLRVEHFKPWQQEAYPRGAIEVPLTEGALAVPGRHSKEHVMHGGARPESGMDDPGPNSKGGHQHTSHRPVRDPIKGGGGADRHSPPHQPADAQCPPGFQFRKRYRDSYNGVKARPVAF